MTMSEKDTGLTPRERAFLADNPDTEYVQLDNSKSGEIATSVKDQRVPDEQLKGVGGWLLVLVVLFFVGSLYRLGGTVTEIDATEADNMGLAGSAAWEALKTKVWILSAVDIVVSVAAAFFLLLKRSRISVHLAIASLWFLGPAKTVIMLRLVETPEELIGMVMLSSAIPAIWTAYLIRSRRVYLTYVGGSEE
jgi:hypothetical protein